MVAYGGGGGILLPSVAWSLGMGTVFLSSLSSVFSAFGVSTFDVTPPVRSAGAGRRRKAWRPRSTRWSTRLGATSAARDSIRTPPCSPRARSRRRPRLAGDLSRPACRPRSTLGHRPGDWLTIALSATCEVTKPGLPRPEPAASPGSRRGRDRAARGARRGRTRPVTVYSWERLLATHRIQGPALIESGGSTYLIPESTSCEVDRFGAAVLEPGGMTRWRPSAESRSTWTWISRPSAGPATGAAPTWVRPGTTTRRDA